MKVYPPRDIRPFVMYCVNGKPRSSLLIESTDSMIYYIYYNYNTYKIRTHTIAAQLKTRLEKHGYKYKRPKKHFKNEQRSKDAAAKKDLIQVE